MSPALRIAIRYLFSPKSHSAVNVISAVSVAGVAVATAAIIVVLSVFNGFHGLIAARLGVLDPPVKIVAADGKVIENADSLAAAVSGLPGICSVAVTLEERALAVMDGRQAPVRIKGVPVETYDSVTGLSSAVIAGEAWSDYYPGISPAVLGVGAANALLAPVGSERLVGLYVPRRKGRINPAVPMAAFRADSVAVSAVFSVNQPEYDADYVYVPLPLARRLLQYTVQGSAVEVMPAPGVSDVDAARAIASAVGPRYDVLDRAGQQSGAFQIVNMEKWTGFMLLAFILIIASFNIISSMSLLIIEKEDNARTLKALGASPGLIRRIYAVQGWLVSIAGGVAGMALGVLLSLGQEKWGWIRLAGDSSQLSLTAYPVEFHSADLIPVMTLVALVGAVTAVFAARRAA